MSKAHPDQKYIEGLAIQNHQIVREIDKKYKRIVIAWIRDNSGSIEDAEDIYVESILAVFDRISQKEPLILSRPFSAYLMGIARNKWYKILRERKKELVVRNDQIKQYIDGRDKSIEEEIVNIEQVSERQVRLDTTFKQLSALCQKLLEMIFYQGLSTGEIVKALEFNTENTYYVRRKRCLERWRLLLTESK